MEGNSSVLSVKVFDRRISTLQSWAGGDAFIGDAEIPITAEDFRFSSGREYHLPIRNKGKCNGMLIVDVSLIMPAERMRGIHSFCK